MDQLDLESSLREYKKFFDEANVGLCRFDIKTGRVLMANDFFARMLGFDAAATIIAGTETLGKLCGKDEKQRLMARLRKEGEVNDYEMKLEANGRSVWVSAYLHINCGGTCIQGTIINITNQKRAEFELEVLRSKQVLKLTNIGHKLDSLINDLD